MQRASPNRILVEPRDLFVIASVSHAHWGVSQNGEPSVWLVSLCLPFQSNKHQQTQMEFQLPTRGARFLPNPRCSTATTSAALPPVLTWGVRSAWCRMRPARASALAAAGRPTETENPTAPTARDASRERRLVDRREARVVAEELDGKMHVGAVSVAYIWINIYIYIYIYMCTHVYIYIFICVFELKGACYLHLWQYETLPMLFLSRTMFPASLGNSFLTQCRIRKVQGLWPPAHSKSGTRGA